MLKFTTFDGVKHAVLLLEPDYANPVEISLGLIAQVNPGMDGQETRNAYSDSLRYKMAYRGTIDGRTRKDFDIGRTRLKNAKVLTPYWIEKSEITGTTGSGIGQVLVDPPIWTEANRYIAWNDQGTYAILTSPRNTQTQTSMWVDLTQLPPAGDDGKRYIAPLMIGRFAKRPEATAERDDAKEYSVEVNEESQYSDRLIPRGVAATNVGGAITEFGLTPLFPLKPDFAQPLDTSTIDTLLQQIGFAREQQESFIDQFAKRGTKLSFSSDSRQEAATLIKFFMDSWGPVKRMWLPTFTEDIRVNGDMTVISNLVPCELNDYATEFPAVDADRHPGIPYVAVVTPASVIPLQVTGVVVSGSNMTLQCATAVGENISVTQDTPIVSALMLARFADPGLKLTFTSDSVWDAEVEFVECAEEYNGPDGTGKRIGYLYQFDMPAAALSWRYTSYENQLTLAGEIHQVGPFEHTGIKKSINLDGEECEIISFKQAGNPLMLFIPSAPEAPMFVKVLKVDSVAPDGSEKILFSGQIENVKVTGPRLDAMCVPVGSALEQKLPKFYIQRACNYDLYGVGTCGVDPNAHKVSGAITARDDTNSTVDVTTLTNSGDTRPDQYFANGWLESGSGATKEFRAVLRSIAIAGGQRLYLNRPLLAGAAAVDFWPGCDWQFTGGCLKFNNQLRFGGFPELPETNPSVEAVPLNPGEARRK